MKIKKKLKSYKNEIKIIVMMRMSHNICLNALIAIKVFNYINN